MDIGRRKRWVAKDSWFEGTSRPRATQRCCQAIALHDARVKTDQPDSQQTILICLTFTCERHSTNSHPCASSNCAPLVTPVAPRTGMALFTALSHFTVTRSRFVFSRHMRTLCSRVHTPLDGCHDSLQRTHLALGELWAVATASLQACSLSSVDLSGAFALSLPSILLYFVVDGEHNSVWGEQKYHGPVSNRSRVWAGVDGRPPLMVEVRRVTRFLPH